MSPAHDLDPPGAHTEVVRDQSAHGDVGLVVDWGGHDSDDETAIWAFAHLIPSRPRDHPYGETIVR